MEAVARQLLDQPLEQQADRVGPEELRREADTDRTIVRCRRSRAVRRGGRQGRAGALVERGDRLLQRFVVERVIGEMKAGLADLLLGVDQGQAAVA